MNIKYQLIFIGDFCSLENDIVDTFFLRIADLGLKKFSFSIISEINFNSDYKANSPSVCLYFANKGNFNLDILDILIADAVFILPVVPELDNYKKFVPIQLIQVNGFPLSDSKGIEALVGRIMEGFSLLRNSRRLFISYRRIESRSVAIQLYEHLDYCGFDVFLDTHSLRPGDIFQDELWHRLVDTDVVVLLDTPGFLESAWTERELAKASAMSIGVLQIIWPESKRNPYSTLCYPFFLSEDDFESKDFKSMTSNLTFETLSKIDSEVESLRARNLSSRQDNLIQEFIASSKKFSLNVNLQPEKIITLVGRSDVELAIIPTVGVPQSFTYNQTEDLIKRIREHKLPKIYLLYDHRNIVEKWQRHLTWLNLYLPIEAIKVTEIENWMTKL